MAYTSHQWLFLQLFVHFGTLFIMLRKKIIQKTSFGDLFVLLFSPEYNVEFFRKFILVMNALDNRGKVFLMFHILLISSSPCQSWLEI